MSHPSLDEWIEIVQVRTQVVSPTSHPSLDEWIEMMWLITASTIVVSHPSLDEWIEIKGKNKLSSAVECLILHWMSGLK